MTTKNPKFMVLSIDGIPVWLIKQLMDEGVMPNMARLVEQVGYRQMRSVHPTVSCVAWASFATGKNPGKHGIFGFIDRQPDSFDLMLPNGSNMTSEHIWDVLSKAGKRVFGMNVPSTYPPRKVNGILIGGFLTPTLDKAAYPAEENQYLKSIDYRIDSDAQLARRDQNAMLNDLDITLQKRMEAMHHYLDMENWDFFHTHIMGTDRLNHFLLERYRQNDPEFAPGFRDYYHKVDREIGRLLERLPDDTPLLMFGDHGFCTLKYEVQLSRYLIEKGWTTAAEKIQHPLSINPARSKAYCTIPGRIYINLAGREPGGIIPVEEYQQTREAITKDLMALRDPDTSEPVIRTVIPREQVYWPAGSHSPNPLDPAQTARLDGTIGRAADLIAIPYDGYDLKLGLVGDTVFKKTELEGMHTYDDAFLVARGVDLPQDNLEIIMLARHILETLDVEPPADMDGADNAITPDF